MNIVVLLSKKGVNDESVRASKKLRRIKAQEAELNANSIIPIKRT